MIRVELSRLVSNRVVAFVAARRVRVLRLAVKAAFLFLLLLGLLLARSPVAHRVFVRVQEILPAPAAAVNAAKRAALRVAGQLKSNSTQVQLKSKV